MNRVGTPEISTLDLFVSVVELGSLGRAAERHHISQPAVSMKMTQLETQVGFRLLERSRGGTRPTRQGERALPLVRKLLESSEMMMAEMAAIRAEQHSHLRVAASLTIAEFLIGEWMGTLTAELPGLSMTLEVANSAEVLSLVRRGAVDLGFREGVALSVSDLNIEKVGSDRLLLVVKPGHKWSRRKAPVTPEELAQTEIIAREPGSGTREVLEEAMMPYGGIHTRRELGSPAAVLQAARSGYAPAVISELTAASSISSGTLVEIPVERLDLRRHFQVIWLADRPVSELARRLVELARRSPFDSGQ